MCCPTAPSSLISSWAQNTVYIFMFPLYSSHCPKTSSYLHVFGTLKGNQRTQRKLGQSQEEHVNPHTDSNSSSGSNLGPWQCETGMLPSLSLWEPIWAFSAFFIMLMSFYHQTGYKTFTCSGTSVSCCTLIYSTSGEGFLFCLFIAGFLLSYVKLT